ncbi:hypothetical protein Csa_013332 [Cucumis sativus]|uniref:Uncharacterized protein n=1 Tax=Cucumis sativus TaxID=3659 RepID=A0A0A0LNV9_CUCSA|nr:hypothetical protein Csa_013332 [Cucumis sativus]
MGGFCTSNFHVWKNPMKLDMRVLQISQIIDMGFLLVESRFHPKPVHFNERVDHVLSPQAPLDLLASIWRSILRFTGDPLPFVANTFIRVINQFCVLHHILPEK